MMSRRPLLRRLADRLGILPGYLDATGTRRVVTSDETRIALLGVMGIEAATERQARDALGAIERERRERLMPPATVVFPKPHSRLSVRIHLPRRPRAGRWWSASLCREDGAIHRFEGRVGPSTRGWFDIPLPRDLPFGYHGFTLLLSSSYGEAEATQLLIVCPSACFHLPPDIGNPHHVGVCANLYSIRSRRNWGIGDFGDLNKLCRWAGTWRMPFVGLNPLHALFNRGDDVSPYSPLSRLFLNPIYIDVAAVPEWNTCVAARRRLEQPRFQRALASLRNRSDLDYETVMSLKLRVLRLLHAEFLNRARIASTPRHREYRRFRDRQGESLDRFATFLAFDEGFSAKDAVRSWENWPAGFRNPESEEVLAFERNHETEVDFHRFAQFEADRQLGRAHDSARTEGMRLGLYQDLALGVGSSSFDVWNHPALFVRGATLGAPPDDYCAAGQDWGIIPLDPRALQADGYRYWTAVLRRAFRHSGAVRIDHAMSLLRQFWVPHGTEAANGAYVRYPTKELFGILALESVRHQAIVIGEDLGTVPRGFASLLARWRVLSCRVLYFQRRRNGAFLPSSSYSSRALVTATTHDHPPLAAFWNDTDISLRRSLGLIDSDAAAGHARADRGRAKIALLRLLKREGLLTEDECDPRLDFSRLRKAIHAFLAKTPASLVGLMLDDLTGETTPVNLPGAPLHRFRSWTRRMSRSLESLTADPALREELRSISRGRRARGRPFRTNPR